MPTLMEAVRFASDPGTSAAQLRRACELLYLMPTGDAQADRAQLLAHLRRLDESAAVVCLNPKLTGSG